MIDGAAYFESLADAVERAQKNIYIAAWDIDSRIQLLKRADSANGCPNLGDFLNAKAKGTPGLHIYVLNWDFPMLYVREREWLPVLNLGWKTHRRIHYHLDDEHPLGASQHQKFVVIDNRIAFCGGFDLSNSRWDTPEHRLHDPRRKNSDSAPYGPFHDIQMLVDGDAAESLAELFRARWEWATGDCIPAEQGESNDPWPEKHTPDFRDIQVAISRTLPAYKGRQGVQEVEKLYKDSIAAAKQIIYIESQYLTSAAIAEALEKSLAEKNGPEMVIVLPRESSGWLEQSTMDSLRARVLERLFAADRRDRLRVLYPALEDGETSVYVHSKIMIVDDQLIVIGSANLSNRSMGFDSECNLAVEAQDDSKARTAIVCLRNRLLAEHLGIPADSANSAFFDQPSVIRAIEYLSSSSGRSLRAIDYQRAPPIDGASIVQDHTILDPEVPIEFDRMMDRCVEDEDKPSRTRRAVTVLCVLFFLAALAAFWRLGQLPEWIASEHFSAWAHAISGHPLSLAIVVAAYVAGGVIMVPVTLLIVVTAMVYSPFWGVVYSWAGCLVSALTTFFIGSKLGKNTVRTIAGKRLNRLGRHLAGRGILSVALIRTIPVATFTVVNIAAGASRISVRYFTAGTALGMLPGIVMITLFTNRFIKAVEQPSWLNTLSAAGLGVALVFGVWWTTKRLTQRKSARGYR